jgi:cytochrome oxidase Cu insertion factor (SCO1/SenC/PrrC family)
MRRIALPVALAALLVFGSAFHARADEGQGEADPNATTAGLDIGTHWFGAEVKKEDLAGKVVLVELWGS